MQLKVAIVEDETIIRMGIRKKIENLNTKVIFDTDNGYNLLEYIRLAGEVCFDVLFVDICMPMIDGLELMERVLKERAGLRIVILSGHNNFEYAQKALRIGAYDYLLKPIESEALSTLFKKIENEVEKDKLTKLQDAIENIVYHISGKGKNKIPINCKRTIRESFPKGFYACIVLINNWESNKNWFEKEYPKESCFVYPNKPNLLVCFLENKELTTRIEQEEGECYTYYYSKKIWDTDNLYNIIHNGKESIKDNIVLGKKIELEEGICQYTEKLMNQWSQYFEKCFFILVHLIEDRNEEEIKRHIKQIMRYPNVPQVQLEKAWYKIARRLIKEYHLEEEFIEDNSLQECDTLECFIEEILEMVDIILDESDINKELEKNKDVLSTIISYVDENYGEDITLKGMSEKYYINRSHLSRIFKLKMGVTFNNYLTNLRIKEACELILAGVNICKVSEMVGYSNGRYFSRVFYKSIGCMPSKYKEVKENENET